MPHDPISKFRRWLRQAQRAGAPRAEAMALATVDSQGRPAVRSILLKQANENGLVFYTNARSRKGRELQRNPRASAVFYWDHTRKQVRVDGRVKALPSAVADAYWKTRPRASQLAGVASQQSAPLKSRRTLVARWQKLRRQYKGREVPRPRHWRGFCIVPDAIEFWTRREPRLHDRELFVRTRRGWKRTLLQP